MAAPLVPSTTTLNLSKIRNLAMSLFILALCAVFYIGLIAGGFLRDRVWIGKADSGIRMLCGKQFYTVTRDEIQPKEWK